MLGLLDFGMESVGWLTPVSVLIVMIRSFNTRPVLPVMTHRHQVAIVGAVAWMVAGQTQGLLWSSRIE